MNKANKPLITILTFFLFGSLVFAQESKSELLGNVLDRNLKEDTFRKILPQIALPENEKYQPDELPRNGFSVSLIADASTDFDNQRSEDVEQNDITKETKTPNYSASSNHAFINVSFEPIEPKPNVDIDDPDDQDITSGKPPSGNKFHWKPAIQQSLIFLTIQHGVRLLQPRTRNRLDGKFFADWGKSVRSLRGWRDGDNWITNYIEHSMQGAVTGRIFVNNSEKSRRLEFGKSSKYWKSRAKTMAWSAIWSTQFELGPYSEATIGNVGIDATPEFSKMAWSDLVITPTLGTGFMIGEDILDKFVLRNWLEKRAKTKMGIRLLRMFVTPFHAFTNAISGRKPWRRYDRKLRQ